MIFWFTKVPEQEKENSRWGKSKDCYQEWCDNPKLHASLQQSEMKSNLSLIWWLKTHLNELWLKEISSNFLVALSPTDQQRLKTSSHRLSPLICFLHPLTSAENLCQDDRQSCLFGSKTIKDDGLSTKSQLIGPGLKENSNWLKYLAFSSLYVTKCLFFLS